MKKYYTERWKPTKIQCREITRESEKCVWYKSEWRKEEVRETKISEHHKWHDTWKEAFDWLLTRAERRVRYTTASLESYRDDLEIIRLLQPLQEETK